MSGRRVEADGGECGGEVLWACGELDGDEAATGGLWGDGYQLRGRGHPHLSLVSRGGQVSPLLRRSLRLSVGGRPVPLALEILGGLRALSELKKVPDLLR